MRLSANGRRLIQSFEGLSLKAYPDAAGYSIGYGHFGAKAGDVISRDEAERLFDQDVVKYETAVSFTTPNATQDQFDAMTSLTYNIGTAGFAKSSVAQRHNMGDLAGAADAFRMWNKSQGKELSVLTNRREKERSVYLHGHGYYSSPAVSSATSVATDPKKGGVLFQVIFGSALGAALVWQGAKRLGYRLPKFPKLA